MNQSDIRMGWPAALNCIPLETRKAHVTPPRDQAWDDQFECFDWTHVGMHTVQQSINGAADRKVRLEADPPREADLLRPAAPPSTTDKPQGVWVYTRDRKPPKPGRYTVRILSVWPGMQWDGEQWAGIDAELSQCWEWLDETPQADAGWIPWDPREEKKPPKYGVYVDLKTKTTGEYKRQLYGPGMHWWWSGEIVAYRIVKEPA